MRASSRRALTLVELLVVVGIIALLIALLLPTIARAREHANRVKCAANLRSIGQAMAMYTQQYGYYPGNDATSGPGRTFAVWPVRIRAFMGGGREVFNCPSQDERCRWEAVAVGIDAATNMHASFGYELGEPVIGNATYFSYGFNSDGTGSGPGGVQRGLGNRVDSPHNPFRELKASRVRVPSRMIAVTDSNADGWGDYCVGPWTSTPGNVVHTEPGKVHNAGANVLFCDGHVDWFPQKKLVAVIPDGSNVVWQEMRRMWNADHRASLTD